MSELHYQGAEPGCGLSLIQSGKCRIGALGFVTHSYRRDGMSHDNSRLHRDWRADRPARVGFRRPVFRAASCSRLAPLLCVPRVSRWI